LARKLHVKLIERALPVASTCGFFTSDGLTHQTRESSLPKSTQKLYDEYRVMAYNHLFDRRSQPSGFFG
jgi:guanyl-specific ribonuclease Sa